MSLPAIVARGSYRLVLVSTLIIPVLSVRAAGQAPAGPGVAQSFEQLEVLVSPGQKISVTDVEGRRYSGTIAGLSSSSLSVMVGNELRQLQESDIATLRQRRSDSLGNGALWGLAAGVTVGMVQCGRCHVGPGLAIGALYGGAGAGIGVALDALIKSDLVVYQSRGPAATRVSVVPQLAPSHQGVALAIKF